MISFIVITWCIVTLLQSELPLRTAEMVYVTAPAAHIPGKHQVTFGSFDVHRRCFFFFLKLWLMMLMTLKRSENIEENIGSFK